MVEPSYIEKRQYVRMNTVFPVEVEILDEAGRKCSSGLLQAFTRDVSAGGMRLELKSFDKATEKFLESPNLSFDLTINTPFSRNPIQARSKVAWLKKRENPLPVRYFIGVAYTQIDPAAQKRLIQYARQLLWIPRLVLGAGVVLLVALALLFWHDQELVRQNKLLVSQLVVGAERRSKVNLDIEALQKRKLSFEEELRQANATIKKMQEALASLTAENMSQKETYEKELAAGLEKEKRLSFELKSLEEGKVRLETTYRTLRQTQEAGTASLLKQMYAWVKSHQNLHTGLIASFEGDLSLEDWAFTYDQSLAAQTFLLFGDTTHAEAILSFYAKRATKYNGAYYNAYDATDGHPMESTIHAGPNVWIGIAALQYGHRLNNKTYLPVAEGVAEWLLALQDEEGGIKGGPTVSWYSTEHNLDAYAFFSMLYQETGRERYKAAQEKVLAWIKKYAYTVKERRLNRGKGDATIATDTFSWAIAAIGPERLSELEFDPEAIADFAEKNCEVTVNYTQPDGALAEAKGFDFAKAENVGRGGVISTEWTAQMVIAYRMLANYFEKGGNPPKAEVYARKAELYLNELQKLLITSPSRTGQGRGCLPYASIDNVDTGHGWRSPKGQRTGSVSGTVYGIFAWTGYNPFDLVQKIEVS
ncbi:MAG: PilZ domain-containing protein [Candidatus Omnitrophica bacterium]|nr:PilZ domain-containing protein [Candidatus Omnitrophota bacterium]